MQSEDLYFFKRRYEGEKIDMGDLVEVVAPEGYLGDSFKRTAEDYFSNLEAHPPRFVMMGGGMYSFHVISFALAHLVAERYTIVLTAPGPLLANGGLNGVLYQLKEPAPGSKPL